MISDMTAFLHTMYTANSVKVVLQKAYTVNYERARDDGLLLIFTSKHGITTLKRTGLIEIGA